MEQKTDSNERPCLSKQRRPTETELIQVQFKNWTNIAISDCGDVSCWSCGVACSCAPFDDAWLCLEVVSSICFSSDGTTHTKASIANGNHRSNSGCQRDSFED